MAEQLGRRHFVLIGESACDRNLAMYFVSSIKEDRLLQILDHYVVGDHERSIEQVKVVANLAKRCLAVRGEDRPPMKEVATELEGLSKEMHPWAQEENDILRSEKTEYLLKPSNDHHHFIVEDDHGATTTSTNTITAAFDSMKAQIDKY